MGWFDFFPACKVALARWSFPALPCLPFCSLLSQTLSPRAQYFVWPVRRATVFDYYRNTGTGYWGLCQQWCKTSLWWLLPILFFITNLFLLLWLVPTGDLRQHPILQKFTISARYIYLHAYILRGPVAFIGAHTCNLSITSMPLQPPKEETIVGRGRRGAGFPPICVNSYLIVIKRIRWHGVMNF